MFNLLTSKHKKKPLYFLLNNELDQLVELETVHKQS